MHLGKLLLPLCGGKPLGVEHAERLRMKGRDAKWHRRTEAHDLVLGCSMSGVAAPACNPEGCDKRQSAAHIHESLHSILLVVSMSCKYKIDPPACKLGTGVIARLLLSLLRLPPHC